MTRSRQPGTPQLLRALNDRAALELLLAQGPLTRSRIGELTGLSKVTASQMIERLERRGLVEPVGRTAGGRGPNAQLYAVVASSAYVVGMDITPGRITAMCADLTGATAGRVEVAAGIADDPVGMVHTALRQVTEQSAVPLAKIRHIVLGSPGVVDPRTGEVEFSWELPRWHRGLLTTLRAELARPVRIENDVNLAAVAEHRLGAARGSDDFILFWADRGLGLGVMLGGRLHRGVLGAAGEIGYLPVPGRPVERDVSRRFKAPLSAFAGSLPVLELAVEHGLPADTVAAAVSAAGNAGRRGDQFLDEVARRLALGAVAVSVVLDPGLIVLAGAIGRAGAADLAGRLEREVRAIAPVLPRVVSTGVDTDPVLHGALLTAVDAAREDVLEFVANSAPEPEPLDAAR